MTETGATRHILHVDMDAFYAAIEQRDHPELRGRPVVVGSPPDRRGVVSTASYEARVYGIHSAMPSRTAYRLCPHAVFLPVRMERYREVSRRIMAIFKDVTPFVEPLSVDEAFLDISATTQRPGRSAVAVARRIKERIRDETGLTGSVGVAPNKFLAKLGSDMDKPDGLTVLPRDPEEIRAFLGGLPATSIWGVGKVTGERLKRFGIETVADIQNIAYPELVRITGRAAAVQLKQLALGRDDRPVVTAREEKSISSEDTFPEDCSDPRILRQTLIEQTENVGRRLRRSGKKAATATLKLRFSNFRTITRQCPLRPPTSSDRALLRSALRLYRRENVADPIRLIGFGVSNLSEPEAADTHQPLLFDLESFGTQTSRQDVELDRVVDELRERYGGTILRRGEWGR